MTNNAPQQASPESRLNQIVADALRVASTVRPEDYPMHLHELRRGEIRKHTMFDWNTALTPNALRRLADDFEQNRLRVEGGW